MLTCLSIHWVNCWAVRRGSPCLLLFFFLQNSVNCGLGIHVLQGKVKSFCASSQLANQWLCSNGSFSCKWEDFSLNCPQTSSKNLACKEDVVFCFDWHLLPCSSLKNSISRGNPVILCKSRDKREYRSWVREPYLFPLIFYRLCFADRDVKRALGHRVWPK